MAESYLLEMRNISKAFGENLVLKNVDLCVQAGQVLALLGENGAGKSTMIKILAGIHSKDSGKIFFGSYGEIENSSTLHSKDKNRSDKPIAFIHQDLGLIDWMTVAENMAFSLGYPRNKLALVDWQKLEIQARDALLQVGVDLSPRKRIFALSQAEKAIVAIARALATKAQLLVLDEPTASLPAADVNKLFAIISQLKQHRVGMIYITHRMDELAKIADRVLILRDGEVVADEHTAKMGSEEIVASIVGKKQADRSYRAPLLRKPAAALQADEELAEPERVLGLSNFQVGEVGPLDLELGKGEMLGLVGLRGAGHELIGRSLFGIEDIIAGAVELCGKRYSMDSVAKHPAKFSPKWAIKNGISLLAANRISESLVLNMDLEENLFLNQQNHGYQAYQLYSLRAMEARSEDYIHRLDIHPGDPAIDISALSGGNQQKVVLSRWLDINNDILILEDPTAGVDVGARAEIYQIFLDILAEGKSLLLISTDFEEVAKICSRVLVFNKNQISQELRGKELTHESIFFYASN